MPSKTESQIRHEMLIDFLSKFSQYQSEDGKPMLRKIPDSLTNDKLHKIDANSINKAIIVFTDVLNIYSGSAGDVNLYRLMQAYIGVPECREKINKLVYEALHLGK